MANPDVRRHIVSLEVLKQSGHSDTLQNLRMQQHLPLKKEALEADHQNYLGPADGLSIQYANKTCLADWGHDMTRHANANIML